MRLLFFPLFIAALIASAATVCAAEGGFIATLSQDEQAAAGLTRLSAEQQVALNALVAREVTFARQGGVTAFAGTFFSRRRPEERVNAGLDQLSAAEIERLNTLVAGAIASSPVPVTTTRRMREEELRRQRRVEVHGEVSFVYGWGPGGRDWRGGSVYTEFYDRDTGVSLGVGLSSYHGDGWWSPYAYDDGYYYDRPAYRSIGAGVVRAMPAPSFCRRR